MLFKLSSRAVSLCSASNAGSLYVAFLGIMVGWKGRGVLGFSLPSRKASLGSGVRESQVQRWLVDLDVLQFQHP